MRPVPAVVRSSRWWSSRSCAFSNRAAVDAPALAGDRVGVDGDARGRARRPGARPRAAAPGAAARRAPVRRPGRRRRRGRARRSARARGRRACRLDRADLVGPAEHRGAAHGGQLQRRRGPRARSGRPRRGRTARRAGPPRGGCRPRCWRRRRRRGRRGRRRRAGPGCGRCPAPSRAFDDGQCATPVRGRADPSSRRRRRGGSRGRTTRRRRSSPAPRRTPAGEQPKRSRQKSSSSSGLGEVGVQQRRRARGPARRTRASGRRSPRTASTGPARRAASRRATGRASGDAPRPTRPGSRRGRLDDVVGRQAAVALPEVHRAAGRVEAQPHLLRRADLGAEHVAAVAGEDVVVVARGGAAGQRQLGQRAGRAEVCTACSSMPAHTG